MADGKYIIKDLGNLSGEVLVFGGPYSNLEATRALISVAESRMIPANHRICTGDAVAYCADPQETLHTVMQNGVLIAGNCEKQIARGGADCGCGFATGSVCETLSRDWYPFARAAMSDIDRRDLALLPDSVVFRHNGLRYCVIHGGLTDISRFIWPTSAALVFEQEIAAIEQKIGKIDAVLSGHCGIAFERHIAGINWINAGVIGMPPHDGRAEGRYVILGEKGARIMRLSYSADVAAGKMRATGLTQGYDKTLLSGIWPSEDILPAELRR